MTGVSPTSSSDDGGISIESAWLRSQMALAHGDGSMAPLRRAVSLLSMTPFERACALIEEQILLSFAVLPARLGVSGG